MKILERTIYPVGFGAFFMEKFLDPKGEDDFYVVYDCGSCTQGMNTRICSIVANEIPKVDVLFISHFHQDHINELHQLLITKNSIVVLPYICDKYQQLYEFIYQMEYTQILAYLIQIGAKIVFVDPSEIGGNEGVRNIEGKQIEEAFDIESLVGQQTHCFPFNILKYAKYNWLYIPFHLQDKSVYKTFVADVLSSGVTVDELLHFDGKDKKLTAKLKRQYKQTCKRDKVCQNFNVSIMLLVSRPENANQCVMGLFDLQWNYLDQNRLNGAANPGCFYTGDMFTANLLRVCKGYLLHQGLYIIPAWLYGFAFLVLLAVLILAVAKVVQEFVYLLYVVHNIHISPQIFHGLQLASRIEQATYNKMSEHFVCDAAIADFIIERSENKFRAYHL